MNIALVDTLENWDSKDSLPQILEVAKIYWQRQVYFIKTKFAAILQKAYRFSDVTFAHKVRLQNSHNIYMQKLLNDEEKMVD